MKRLFTLSVCAVMILAVCACGGKQKKIAAMERLSPDTLITAETVSAICGFTVQADSEGVTNNGSARSITYNASPVGSQDPVTVSIEQFSETLTASQVWSDYENSRIRREDMEFVNGIGEDCYIAYPYINVYNRGCFIRISAGSGDDEAQKELLKSLAVSVVAAVNEKIPENLAEITAENVIK